MIFVIKGFSSYYKRKKNNNMRGIIGKKLGMTRLFDEAGNMIPVTVIEAGPCYVSQVKTEGTDGYNAVQLAFDEKREKRTTKPALGHFKKAGLKPYRVVKEFRDFESEESLKLGDTVTVDVFTEGEIVDISGRSKGKGFTGVVKRHKFGGGPKTHGQSDRYRAPGSIGSSSWPSRVLKGTKMAGRLGGTVVTKRNSQIVKIDNENNLIIVKGPVPGANQGIVIIKK